MGRSTWWSAQALAALFVVGCGVTVAAPPAGDPKGDPPAPWVAPIQRVDAALARREYTAALGAVQEAYGLALASQRWEGLVAAGDAYRRIGEATDLRQSFGAKARQAYSAALGRARQQASSNAVLRVAEAFAALGDAEVVAQCIRIAEGLAAHDPEAQANVRAFAARWAELALTVNQTRH